MYYTKKSSLYEFIFEGKERKQNMDKFIINKNTVVDNSAKENKCNLIIATPPCQGMSVAGKMDQNDPRNKLIIFVIQSILDLNADFALIENVPGILKFFIKVNDKWIKITDYILNKLKKKYNI